MAEVLGAKVSVDVACHPFNMTLPACQVLKQLLSRGKVHTPDSTSTSHELSVTEVTTETEAEIESETIPHFQPCPNQLALTLMNINSVWHPCITYGRFHGTNLMLSFVYNSLSMLCVYLPCNES